MILTNSDNKILLSDSNKVIQRIVQPNTFSGLTLWLKAESLSGYTNGSSVTSWTDSSGNGYNATQGAVAPTCATNFIAGGNGLNYNAVFFNIATGPTLSCVASGFTFYNNFTVFVVAYQTSTTANSAVILDKGQSNYNVSGWYVDANVLGLQKGGGSNGAIAGNIQFDGTGLNYNYLNHWKALSFIIQSSGAITGWINGVSGAPVPGIMATANSNNLIIGTYGVANTSFGGYLAEIIIYKTALTTNQRQDVENYLRLKFKF